MTTRASANTAPTVPRSTICWANSRTRSVPIRYRSRYLDHKFWPITPKIASRGPANCATTRILCDVFDRSKSGDQQPMALKPDNHADRNEKKRNRRFSYANSHRACKTPADQRTLIAGNRSKRESKGKKSDGEVACARCQNKQVGRRLSSPTNPYHDQLNDRTDQRCGNDNAHLSATLQDA